MPPSPQGIFTHSAWRGLAAIRAAAVLALAGRPGWPCAAARDAHALLLVTEWPQFAGLDLEHLRQVMRYPVIIDGRNLFDPKQMAEAGFHYYSMGRPLAEPKVLAQEAAGLV